VTMCATTGNLALLKALICSKCIKHLLTIV
jgi:hypothetical protein